MRSRTLGNPWAAIGADGSSTDIAALRAVLGVGAALVMTATPLPGV